MTERSRSFNRVMSAPAFVGLGFAWFAAVLYLLLGHVIVRQTALGSVAKQLDRLPMWLANVVYILCWLLFLLGWIVPLFFGFKRLLRRTGKDVS